MSLEYEPSSEPLHISAQKAVGSEPGEVSSRARRSLRNTRSLLDHPPPMQPSVWARGGLASLSPSPQRHKLAPPGAWCRNAPSELRQSPDSHAPPPSSFPPVRTRSKGSGVRAWRGLLSRAEIVEEHQKLAPLCQAQPLPVLNLRTTTSQKCEAVPRRARI